MKKIIIAILAIGLVSCGSSQNISITNFETPAQATSRVTQTGIILTPGEQQKIDEYLVEYEKTLRASGKFSEDIIKQALEIKKQEQIKNLTNH